MNEHIERMVDEFIETWSHRYYRNEDATKDERFIDIREHGVTMMKMHLKDSLTSAYNAGLEKAIVLASTTTWDNMRLDSAGYMIGMSDARICITAAIEKEKLDGKQSPQ